MRDNLEFKRVEKKWENNGSKKDERKLENIKKTQKNTKQKEVEKK